MTVIVGLLASTIASATPLLLAALGEVVAQRSGVVNVGMEGMMLGGAFAASATALFLHSLPAAVLAAAASGALFAVLLAAAAIYLNANQIVVGIVIDLLALGVTSTLYREITSSRGPMVTAALPQLWNLTILTPVALCLVPLIWLWLNTTRSGLQFRACGEKPEAAEAAGISVRAVRSTALLFGGALAGLAGAYLSVGENSTFVPNMSAGRGFIALAIVTAGRWSPWGCVAAATVFGFTDALQYEGQALGLDAAYRRLLSQFGLLRRASALNMGHLPYQLFLAAPYVATLLILAYGSRSVRAPESLGRPYRRS